MVFRQAVKKISVIIGTRPEVIKMSPVVRALKASGKVVVNLCTTGQQHELVFQSLPWFELSPDSDLAVMEPNQELNALASRLMLSLESYLKEAKPDLVLVQGDTTSAFCSALAAFHRKIPVGHVEAGLRTHDPLAPFPEELNRVLISRIAGYHFAPTRHSRDNLCAEGVGAHKIHVTGNPVVDALLYTSEKLKRIEINIPEVPGNLFEEGTSSRIILITSHRRESFGRGLRAICSAIRQLAVKYSGGSFIFPLHLNSSVREPVRKELSGLRNVYLTDPLSYPSFVYLMMQSTLILTDSGGVQEEAPSLGKPVLVMREKSERTEGVAAGFLRIVGTDSVEIEREASLVLENADAQVSPIPSVNPYGDGKAGDRIARICLDLMGV